MFDNVDMQQQLNLCRKKNRKEEDVLLAEAKQILRKDLFTDEKVLHNLKQYNRLFEVVNEEDVDPSDIFTIYEIKTVAVTHFFYPVVDNFRPKKQSNGDGNQSWNRSTHDTICRIGA